MELVVMAKRESKAETGSTFGNVEADNDGDVKTGSNGCASFAGAADESKDLQDGVCRAGGMSRLAIPEVGILGWRAGMPGWMVGGPGALVIIARSSVAILPSMRQHHQLIMINADGSQEKNR